MCDVIKTLTVRTGGGGQAPRNAFEFIMMEKVLYLFIYNIFIYSLFLFYFIYTNKTYMCRPFNRWGD